MLSALILTLNEESTLAPCIESLSWCDDVVVLDSGSSDRTAEIAREKGARVFERPFDNFAGQRNFASDTIPFLHPWVFHLDADERFTPELQRECLHHLPTADDVDGFYVAPKMMFLGKWIRHCTDFPAYQARLVRPATFRFEEVGHGQREARSMRMRHLSGTYVHDLSIRGTDDLRERHRRYAEIEGRAAARDRRPTIRDAVALLKTNPLDRRRALKRLSFRFPFRGTARFLYQYGMRGGFLDGRPGLIYCCLLHEYESLAGACYRRVRREYAK